MITSSVPDQAEIVIVGGGIAGCSVAYHLSQLGHRDIVLLERKTLTSGTTWHAAGLLAQLRGNQTQTKLAQYSLDLYEQLEKETGQATGIRRNGTILLARSKDRWIELKRRYSAAKLFELDCELIGPDEINGYWNLLVTNDLQGGLHVPSDGQIDPTGVTLALAKGARSAGVEVFENTKVTGFRKSRERILCTETNHGNIRCDIVVNCAGIWAREIGKLAGASIPVQAVEHMYLVTEPIAELEPGIPSLRDYDGLTYFKEDAGKLVMGGTEKEARPWGIDGIPENFEFTLLGEDWDQFEELIVSATERMPALAEAGIRQFLNGPESFTPDGQYVVGPCLEATNLFVCAGFNSIGICMSGGAGKAVAEWIHAGEPTCDLSSVDVRRFYRFQANKHYLQSRVRETVSGAFDMHWPYKQTTTARGVRRSALHHLLLERNACFGEVAGWERPNWFAPKGKEPVYEYSYGKQNWFDYSANEHKTIRERVGLIDVSSFSKILIEGTDALRLLQKLCTRDMDTAMNNVVYTLMLNPSGGIECDLTITRLADGKFLIYCGAGAYNHVVGWIASHIHAKWNVYLNDVTSSTGVIAVMGPQSRNLLSKLTDADLSNNSFPFMTCQEIEISHTICRASRVTFVGELGWELNIPTEFMAIIYEQLVEAGQEFDLLDVGYHAMDSLRIERGYRHYGHDISGFDSPLEAGLKFAVNFDKEDEFIGRKKLLEQEGPVKRRMVVFTFNNPDVLIYHQEPVFCDGQIIGEITSGAYGHTVGSAVGLGYIYNEEGVTKEFIDSGSFEVEVAAERIPVKVALLPVYDPYGNRVRV